MNNRSKIIEAMARAGASFEEVEYDKYSELFIEQAEHMLALLEKSGMAVVAAEDVRRMREALENIASSEPNGLWAQREAFEALASKETEG